VPSCEVRITPAAQRQVAGLRGPTKKAFETFAGDVAHRGCAALGYRLSGSDVLEHICVRHLRGLWRAVVVFPEPAVAWIVLVAEHVTDPGRNVYDLLYAVVGHVPQPESGRTKPPCCDIGGEPPLVGDPLVDELVVRTREVFGRRR
jgi:hypothetical protein